MKWDEMHCNSSASELSHPRRRLTKPLSSHASLIRVLDLQRLKLIAENGAFSSDIVLCE